MQTDDRAGLPLMTTYFPSQYFITDPWFFHVYIFLPGMYFVDSAGQIHIC